MGFSCRTIFCRYLLIFTGMGYNSRIFYNRNFALLKITIAPNVLCINMLCFQDFIEHPDLKIPWQKNTFRLTQTHMSVNIHSGVHELTCVKDNLRMRIIFSKFVLLKRNGHIVHFISENFIVKYVCPWGQDHQHSKVTSQNNYLIKWHKLHFISHEVTRLIAVPSKILFI